VKHKDDNSFGYWKPLQMTNANPAVARHTVLLSQNNYDPICIEEPNRSTVPLLYQSGLAHFGSHENEPAWQKKKNSQLKKILKSPVGNITNSWKRVGSQ